MAILAASLLIASSNEIRLNFCQCLSVCLLNNGRTRRIPQLKKFPEFRNADGNWCIGTDIGMLLPYTTKNLLNKKRKNKIFEMIFKKKISLIKSKDRAKSK